MAGIRRYLAAGCALSVLFCAAPLFAQEASEASVKGIMGSVKVFSSRDRRADPENVNTWPDARLNMTLRSKDMVATLAESEARLETADGSSVRLRENTVLEVSSINSGETKLSLIDGRIVTNVKKMAGNRREFEIRTPTALAAIRGTTLEVDSRKGSGTTVKTFDGKVQVAPADKKKNKKNFSDVGNYQMTEVTAGQASANVRAVPSYYRPKTTKLLSEEEAAALTGFTRVILTYAELEEIKAQLERDGIACGIGVAESGDEMTARKISSDEARVQLAAGMSTQVQRISESYAQNIDGEAKKIWEEGVRQITDVSVRGSSVHTTVTQYNKENGRFKVYSLMVLDPGRMKNSLSNAAGRLEEEHELRVKKDDMMSKLDTSIRAYGTKYHDR
ncbi:MAG: FecR domain-containing protein [Chitinispirillia bacterium]|nr:FecR domain-containing protein [Chitinispirillia bacterium]MCL2268669.1 FecR domain-containing protein [Chitinispirillia bacterium]